MSWYSDKEKFDEFDDDYCKIKCPNGGEHDCDYCEIAHPEKYKESEVI